MPRPRTIGEPTRSYNLMIPQVDLDKVYNLSVKETREKGKHVTMAEVIRKAVRIYITKEESRVNKENNS
jgi:Arc/MetJ-type ribon-helix-helix transcriptional regulator|tara:strand:- start:13243 stop:13449 length:207 start_codon:yes stop_codon:yes gene_type:complete